MSDSPPAQDSRHTIARNARYGLWLFAVYVVFYAGFVAIAALRFDLLGRDVAGGVNLAIAYGLGLIVLAFVLALVYMVLVRAEAKPGASDPGLPQANRSAEGRA
jgi:uncharacterized membrane protein (DUF485 family)